MREELPLVRDERLEERVLGRGQVDRAPSRDTSLRGGRPRALRSSSPASRVPPGARGAARRATRASSSSIPNGLVTKSSAPASSAATLSCWPSRTDSTMTGTSLNARIRADHLRAVEVGQAQVEQDELGRLLRRGQHALLTGPTTATS